MAARRATTWLMAILALVPPLALSACGGDASPTPVFAPLTYGYLRPLRLNVGAVEVTTAWAPGPGDVSGQSPQAPVQALQQMGRDRLIPAGASGRAVLTVEQAGITEAASTLSGLFRIRLDIYTSDGARAAYAEAAVARTAPAPDDDDKVPAALYDLTRQMMADMNVELEYQLRRSIGDWLESSQAVAPPPAPVQQESLQPPTATTPDPRRPGFRLVPVNPPGSGYGS